MDRGLSPLKNTLFDDTPSDCQHQKVACLACGFRADDNPTEPGWLKKQNQRIATAKAVQQQIRQAGNEQANHGGKWSMYGEERRTA